MKEKKAIGQKVQAVITDYNRFVLEGLVDIKGKSVSDVISFIIASYAENKVEYLESIHLGVKDWQKSKREKESI